MTTDTIERDVSITLGERRPLTERDWKAAVCHTLRIFGIIGEAAEIKAGQLYEDYVAEKGFTDQCFAEDPVGAVMDDRAHWSNLSPDPGR